MPLWEIYALRYAGPVTSPGALTLWNRGWDQVAERAYYFWCLLGPGGPVVVDAGTAPGPAKQRGLPNYVPPDEMLARLGVEAASAPHLVLTHLHWDHAGGAELFPAAQIHLHAREWRFWRHEPVARRPVFDFFRDEDALAALDRAKAQGRLVLHPGGGPLPPGLELIEAPGHTPGLMAVGVDTAAGRAVLGSDCGHTFQNYAEDWPSSFICDLPAWLGSMQRLRESAASPELLFPGHDLALSRGYPQAAPGVTRLA